jgi:hypothetical protein
MANGPFWYWVSQQQDDVCRRVTRELLVQGSGGTAWTWHWFARGCCDDFAAIAPKQYLDFHKIADSWTYYTQSFLPADLKTGDYAEFWAQGTLKVFDRSGTVLSSFEIQDVPPMLQPGENRITLRATTAVPAKLTCITTGDALSW